MFNISRTPKGTLKITASNAGRAWIKDHADRCDWRVMADIFEPWSTNGSFAHFDAGRANPLVGLTDAPGVARNAVNVDPSLGCGRPVEPESGQAAVAIPRRVLGRIR